MDPLATIILVPYNSTLAAECGRELPHLKVTTRQDDCAASGPLYYFVDWLLPDGSGLELCRRLRANPQTRDARIFMVLEDHDRETQRRALKAGADDYIVGSLSAAVVRGCSRLWRP